MSKDSVTNNPLPATRAALMERLSYLGQMQSTESALFHQLASAKVGLNITDSKAISALMQEGSMTAGQLAVRLSLTTGAVTSVIDRLESLNYARRSTDPTDRRKVIIEANLKALEKPGKVYDSMGQSFERMLAGYSVEELQFLVNFFQQAIELSKQEIRKLSA